MEEFENNLFKNKGKINPPKSIFNERMQQIIRSTLWVIFLTLGIIVVSTVIEESKSPNWYFHSHFAFLSSVFATLIINTKEIAETPLSSLTIEKLAILIFLYKFFCRLFFPSQKCSD
jgi:hypothetical protein